MGSYVFQKFITLCTFLTFPSKRTSLDNIAVKGLEISDVRMVKTKLSDHYPLVCRISLEE